MFTTRRSAYRCPGFTLIELLVVISIVSLLIAILLPALKSARGASQVVQTLSNLRQLQISVHNYAGDNSGYLPPRDGNPGSGSPSLYPFWPGRLVAGQYTSDPFIFWGPMRNTNWFSAPFSTPAQMRNSPLSATAYQYPGFSASQGVMGSGAGASPVASHRLGSRFKVHNDSVKKNPGESEILVMTEHFDSSAFNGQYKVDGYWMVRQGSDPWLKLFTYRGASTSAYLDGHAVSVDSMTVGWRAYTDRDGVWDKGTNAYWRRQQPWFLNI